jgi:Ca-activated chloride channel family protein
MLATDGDFNVGAASDGEMVELIEKERTKGVFLSVLGFGTGNVKDSKMEQIADKGNGNYSYIDSELEARKVLVSEMGGTLLTIAKDVKIQVEFNPAKVQAYRLVGYENRALRNEDFNDDRKDAGELGAGHSVTALYEVVPVGVASEVVKTDGLKYQTRAVKDAGDELLTVKFRYKDPDGSESKLIVDVVKDGISENPSDNFRFSSAVAGFGMLLRDSEYKGEMTYGRVAGIAKNALAGDAEGYRHEFVRMVERAERLASEQRS